MTENSNQKKPGTGKDVLNKQRLELEIKERKWNLSRWGKVSRIAPFISVILLALSIAGSAFWYARQQRLETERQRQETITNLKREFASENNAVRIGATLALAEYPKEAIPVLIPSLGAIDLDTKEEDTAFTRAVKISIRQIGKDAVMPLVKELRQLQEEIKGILTKNKYTYLKTEYPQQFFLETQIYIPLENIMDKLKIIPGITEAEEESYIRNLGNLNTVLYRPLEDVRNELKDIPGMTEKEIEPIISQLDGVRSSRPGLIVGHKNVVEILVNLLCVHYIIGLDLSEIDFSSAVSLSRAAKLSGANLTNVDLARARLFNANLSNTNLTRANLWNADLTFSNLSGANLTQTDLSSANLHYSNLSNANLKGSNLINAALMGASLAKADLSNANLLRADLSSANLFSAKLSRALLFRTNLQAANIEGADLSEACLSEAILYGVKGFRDIKDFSGTNLKGVKGLSKEDLEDAKSKGAITD